MKQFKNLCLVWIFILGILPLSARNYPRMSLLLEGGKSWGASLNGFLVSGKLLVPIGGRLSLCGAYTHHFKPEQYDRSIECHSFSAGLELKTSLDQNLCWFVHGEGAVIRMRDYPGSDMESEFGVGLGTGLETSLSSLLALRLDLRVMTTFIKDAFFGDTWGETALGLVLRF